ncbi:MAG: hypothetical protein H6625_07505 [Bdellovibrionaceae bacterium]|nr:hypothetical protein [Pseudobdellovibrionaceae bacterium]
MCKKIIERETYFKLSFGRVIALIKHETKYGKQMKYNGIFLVFLTFFVSFAAYSDNKLQNNSEKRKVGILTYLEEDVSSYDFVCEPAAQTKKCYYVTDFYRILKPEDDISGAMNAQKISKGQGAFVEVILNQLIATASPDQYKTTQIFDFYIKLHWKGKRLGLQEDGLDLVDSHIIKGQVVRDAEEGLFIDIISVPDLLLLDTFMPRNLAEIFGRNAHMESFELEHDVKTWIKFLMVPILKSYFDGEPVQINQP